MRTFHPSILFASLRIHFVPVPSMQELYRSVFRCISRPSSWPVVWPCFGRSSSLPQRRMAPVSLSKAQRRLGGHRNDARCSERRAMRRSVRELARAHFFSHNVFSRMCCEPSQFQVTVWRSSKCNFSGRHHAVLGEFV